MIRIRKTPYMNPKGTFATHSDEVRAQLGVIAAGGTNTLPASYGDHDDPADPTNYSLVDYDPGTVDTSTASGRVMDRLRNLVTQTESYEIIGMGWDFVFGDGTTVQVEAGLTLGDTVFYDTTNCNGDGRWIIDTGGNHSCTQSSIILYHELGGHAFLHQPPTLSNADAEAQAIHEENDLRVAMGLTPRDEHQLSSGCGCPGGCCIVASVASGSSYSEEVGELRRLRDGTLRSSRIGEVLFDHIHREYYAFSPAVFRTMVRDPQALMNVETWLVQPLVNVLKLARDYAASPDDAEQLGAKFLAIPAANQIPWESAEWLLRSVATGSMEVAALDSGTSEICNLLASWMPRSPHVQWAIIEPLLIYVRARLQFTAPSDAEEVGTWLAGAFEGWLSEMPVEAVAQDLMASEISADLPKLKQIVGSSVALDHIKARLVRTQPAARTGSEKMQKPHLPVKAVQIECEHRQSGVRISFALENTGDRPFHAVSELRRMALDPATGVLTLWLTERQPPRDASRPDRHVSHPKTRVIDPDRRTTIEFELPKQMTRIVTGPGNKFDFEPLDLSQARSVVLKISIDDKPFYANPKHGSIREQLAKWGTDIETTPVPIETTAKR